jgi:hypothetical protein
MNPLLDFSGLPRFAAKSAPEHVTPADRRIAGRKAALSVAQATDAATTEADLGRTSSSRWTMLSKSSVTRLGPGLASAFGAG